MRKHSMIHASDRSVRLRTGLLCAGVSAAALCLGITPAWAQTEASPTQTTPPAAQTADEAAVQDAQTEDAIVVTGYRQSLQSAQQIKKNSDVIVDSVTAEDIGALPDRSVTETLQRIPGVAINRFAAGVDPDHFSVEGSGVVVRGLTYVRSEFNGREAFSANNGRALSFADVPSELMGGVDVFKSPSADRVEGGIAGVVNLRTRKPFDSKGLVVSASAELNYGDFAEQPSANLNALISNRWQTGIGEIGLLASASYSNLKSRADRLQVSSFRVRNLYSDGDVVDNGGGATVADRVLFPRGAVIGNQEFDRTRYGYSAAAQWRSNDGSMEAVFQFLRSDARQAWTEHAMEIATDNVSSNGDSRRVPGTTLDFDDDGMFVSGVITGPTGWRADQNQQGQGILARVPMLGLQSNVQRRDHDERLVTDDYGFNFKWDVSDRLGLTFDYQHVKSSTYLIDNALWNSTYQNASIALNGSDFPTIEFLPPQVCNGPAANSQNPPGGDFDCAGFGSRATADTTPGQQYAPNYFGAGHTSFTDPFNSFPRAAMDHIEDSDGNSDAARIDLEYSFPDNSFLKSIRAGVRYADREQTARFSTYNWGRLSEQWGNNGPVWLDDNVDGVTGGNGGTAQLGGSNEAYYFDNFFRGQAGNPLAGQGRLFYSLDTVKNYDAYVRYATLVNNEWEAQVANCPNDSVVRNGGWNPLANRCGVVAGTPFLPGEINPIKETNKAAYIMARFDSEFGNGMRLSGNVGVRYTSTKRNSEGVQQFTYGSVYLPTEATCLAPPSDATAVVQGFCAMPLATRTAVRNFQNGALVESPGKINYDYWLPSANVKLEVGGGLQFRAAYFKGVAPPNTGLIRNYGDVRVNAVQNTNPDGTLIPGSFRLQADVNRGNPFLKPVEADNFDLTAEWYFSNVGQLTVSGFYKRLKNVVTNETYRSTYTNNGQTFDALITNPGNATETGTIKGVEVAYQQTFDFLPGFLKGFGVQANYTYIDSSGVPQSTLSETDPDVGAGRVTTVKLESLPLQGLSKHNFNITPFLDVGPLSLRATYSWRSDFLLTIRDVIVPNDPIVNKATGQLDASIFYSLSDNVKIGLQGSNLLNEVVKTTAVVSDPDGNNVEVPRGWYMNDRRISGIMRFTF
ncbi:MAG: TonB-dependent receptor [Sphingomonas sp.]|uniref:TonB-dependent receptor n=1 Tax=Sphingomonas sp. TaxID=28214 RepID=UPI001B1D4472|nr:TonB-dependent receptor [Sphingomonas sp.]MBO9623786.1 TonB-dependent receptor [Sphingomonas sp.]